MLEGAIILGLVMVTVEAVKYFFVPENKAEGFKKLMPFLVLGLGAGLNVLNAWAFGDNPVLREAAKEGIMLSVDAAGIYGLAKAVIGRS